MSLPFACLPDRAENCAQKRSWQSGIWSDWIRIVKADPRFSSCWDVETPDGAEVAMSGSLDEGALKGTYSIRAQGSLLESGSWGATKE
jgi:hypothetical protein